MNPRTSVYTRKAFSPFSPWTPDRSSVLFQSSTSQCSITRLTVKSKESLISFLQLTELSAEHKPKRNKHTRALVFIFQLTWAEMRVRFVLCCSYYFLLSPTVRVMRVGFIFTPSFRIFYMLSRTLRPDTRTVFLHASQPQRPRTRAEAKTYLVGFTCRCV